MSLNELTVRPMADSDMERFLEIDGITFLETPWSAESVALAHSFLETERSIGLFDGTVQVGNASIFTLRMTVPGGIMRPMAGITWVSVLPTHRRRGGLNKLMRHQLDTLHETGGEALAGLTASEDGIYGRFGYGVATYSAGLGIPRHAGALRLPAGTEDVALRLAEPAEARTVCDEIYTRAALRRPGMLERTGPWSDLPILELPEFREGKSLLRCVLAERDGKPVGYAYYRTKSGEDHGVEDRPGEVHVGEVYADDAPAYAALWRMLSGIDLAGQIFMESLPVDDALFSMLESSRAALRAPRRDGMHLRLVDVDRALAARTYSGPIDVVLDVRDGFCPWNAGHWRLSGDEKGAACTRTDSPAELSLDVRDLAAAYLGGRTLVGLAGAGLVTEHRFGALAAASRAFAGDIQPWLPFGI